MGARKGSIFKSKHNFSISEGLCCNNLFPIKKTFSDHWWHNRTLKWPRNRNNNTFGSEHDLTKAIRVKYRIKETDQRESASRGPATLHTGAPMPCHISIQTTWNGKRSGEEKTKNLIIEVQQQPRISGSRLRGAMVFVEPGKQHIRQCQSWTNMRKIHDNFSRAKWQTVASNANANIITKQIDDICNKVRSERFHGLRLHALWLYCLSGKGGGRNTYRYRYLLVGNWSSRMKS